MAHLFKKLFQQQEMPQAEYSLSVPQELAQYDSEYIAYCIEQEQTVSHLESALHISDDPKEIAMQTLETACRFYAADWAGIIELDLDLGITTTGWWYNADPKVTKLQRMNEYENIFPMPTWLNSIRNGQPIILTDMAEVARNSPQEYQVYKRLGANAVVAVPFGPNPLGFLVIRNPQRYQQRTSTLNTLSYVMHRAMAQRDAINRTKMALSPEEIKTDKDIVINFFGNMEIYTKDGVWKEQEFKSPKCSRAVAYIMLHNKTAHSALAIADALYPEDNADVDTINKNVRGYIYRFRKSFDLISEHQLIEYTSNGYRLNPALNVKTDIQQFSNLWKQLQEEMPLPQRVHTLKSAIKLYRGAVFASACDDHWLVGIATKYKMKYISIINELLSILAGFEDYDGIHHFALKALSRVPENVKAHYWVIYAMYHAGTVEMAKQELQHLKKTLTSDEYLTLVGYIEKDDTMQNCQLFE